MQVVEVIRSKKMFKVFQRVLLSGFERKSQWVQSKCLTGYSLFLLFWHIPTLLIFGSFLLNSYFLNRSYFRTSFSKILDTLPMPFLLILLWCVSFSVCFVRSLSLRARVSLLMCHSTRQNNLKVHARSCFLAWFLYHRLDLRWLQGC